MKFLRLLAAPVLILIAGQLHAQQASARGAGEHGVQLFITLTNQVVSAGSFVTLQCQIKNSSTNSVILVVTNPEKNFGISLTNDSGTKYELTPDAGSGGGVMRISKKLAPGHTYEDKLALQIGRNIEAGTYTMTARRKIFIGEEIHELESNRLVVQVR